MKRHGMDRMVIALLFVALCFVFVVRVSRPPAAVSASVPATAFFRRTSNEVCACHRAAAAPDWECGA
jgi:hypothetical protein